MLKTLFSRKSREITPVLQNPLVADPDLLLYFTPDDPAFPIAFSRAPLYCKPDFGVFVEMRVKRDRAQTPYLVFLICESIYGTNDYDTQHPLFADSDFVSLADVWTLFA